MRTAEQYIALVTSQHILKPKFAASVLASIAPFADLQEKILGFINDFDLDAAVGVQLDAVGLWIGLTRGVAIPLNGFYFTWDDTVPTGWNNGVWFGVGDSTTGILNLPDDLYRSILKAKILSNNWKGDIETAYRIIESAFPTLAGHVTIEDNQDMTMTVTVEQSYISAIEAAIISQGYLQIKPVGVEIEYILV